MLWPSASSRGPFLGIFFHISESEEISLYGQSVIIFPIFTLKVFFELTIQIFFLLFLSFQNTQTKSGITQRNLLPTKQFKQINFQ